MTGYDDVSLSRMIDEGLKVASSTSAIPDMVSNRKRKRKAKNGGLDATQQFNGGGGGAVRNRHQRFCKVIH
ncbi:hypothetical protein JG687_00001973 [Phytophthora cactorum]|uniref:Uncharacterized protein n=1 Tax=Phytophthora cactorum TaxID=29920 RepID=A0A8T1UWK8_9STRA|nr:hypothetical protein JG687_00001973 [Phytophthora cactorum]